MILSHRDNYICFAADELGVGVTNLTRIETSCDCVSVTWIEYQDRAGQSKPMIQAYFPADTNATRSVTELIVQCQGVSDSDRTFEFEISCVLIAAQNDSTEVAP
ncbi:hypothetical protein [Rhodopirellula baltica]|uniref:Uncharacterized protein n=1 Tax=Rhodopirellula baltica SWK14 TaxID=993516 RepID=L7CBR5_RHOBT|nr:hypothetical protein [Rhodopirellula baltica]ELP30526.1 hypothetical protein RBSWK_05554 [Rhodopirellula baltica SWK14]